MLDAAAGGLMKSGIGDRGINTQPRHKDTGTTTVGRLAYVLSFSLAEGGDTQ
jgi:hypothetical protein